MNTPSIISQMPDLKGLLIAHFVDKHAAHARHPAADQSDRMAVFRLEHFDIAGHGGHFFAGAGRQKDRRRSTGKPSADAMKRSR